jgi:primosomal protein N' (replication factor Y)
MVAKGHDIPNVTLVGVLSADSALNLPDYRASERTFSLLTQAAGRAGRGDKPGKVIFQDYDVENKVLEQAARQDYDSFATDELKAREMFFYPPFAQMLKMTIWDKDEAAALALAKRVTTFLQGQQLEGKLCDLMVLGPFPGLVAKVRDMYRFNILVKAKDMKTVKEALLASEFKEQRNLFFDVDPVNVI